MSRKVDTGGLVGESPEQSISGAGAGNRQHARMVTIAHAHSGTESYAYVVFDREKITGNIQFPTHDLGHVLDLSFPSDTDHMHAAIRAAYETIRDYAVEHFSILNNDQPVEIRFIGSRSLSRSIGSYAILDYEVIGSKPSEMRAFTIEFDGIIESRHHHEGLVLVHSFRGWGPVRTRDEQRFRFDSETSSHRVELLPDTSGQDALGVAILVRDTVKEYWRRITKRLRSRRES